jgi:hypothetical protein
VELRRRSPGEMFGRLKDVADTSRFRWSFDRGLVLILSWLHPSGQLPLNLLTEFHNYGSTKMIDAIGTLRRKPGSFVM